MRIVRTSQGVQYDPGGKANGRGAYIHEKRDCWEKALQGRLEKALHTTINANDRGSLTKIMNALPQKSDE